MTVYLHTKYLEIELSATTAANLCFQMSIEGRMYASLTRFFAVRPVQRMRALLLDELWEIRRKKDEQQQRAVFQGIEQLSTAYENGFCDACGLPLRFARGCFEARQ